MAVARIVQQFITLSGKAVEYLFWQAGSSGWTSISWDIPSIVGLAVGQVSRSVC